MPDQLQLRGGTTTEHNSFTGALREVTVDTTKKTLVVHDGSQAGGTPLMKESGATAASSVTLGTGGTERLKLTSSEVVFNETSTDTDFRIEGNGDANLFKVDAGNDHIGIGTATPTEKLNILDASQTASARSGGLLLQCSATSGADVGVPLAWKGHVGNGTEAQTYGLASICGRKENATYSFDATSAKGYLQFCTTDNSGTEKMRITSTGNVGIGTTSPAGSIHVDAASGVDGPVFDSGGTNNASHALLVRDSANNQLVRVNNNGNVGIGTASPLYPLHVKGTITQSAPADYGVLMGLSANNDYAQIQLNGDTGAFIDFSDHGIDQKGRISYTHSDNTMAFLTNAGEKMRLNSDGRLGIGTSSPISDLHVTGANNNNGTLSIGGTGTNASGEIFYDVGGLTHFRIKNLYRATNAAAYTEYDSGYHKWTNGTVGDEAMRLQSGRLYIGNHGSSQPIWGVHGHLQLTGTNWDSTAININNFGNNTNRGTLQFMKSKSGTNGDYSVSPAANETIGQINWAAADTGDAANIHAALSVETFAPATANNGYGRFKFTTMNGTSNGVRAIIDNDGLKFNGDTGANNALNDYEEGTFTLAASAMGVTNTNCKYIKIGNLVHCTGELDNGSSGNGALVAQFSGLPFAGQSGTEAGGQGGTIPSHNFGVTVFTQLVSSSNMRVVNDTGSHVTQSVVDDKNMKFNLTYYTT